jgi:hypothetical protein
MRYNKHLVVVNAYRQFTSRSILTRLQETGTSIDPEHVKPAVWRHNNSKTQRSGMSARMCRESNCLRHRQPSVKRSTHTYTHERALPYCFPCRARTDRSDGGRRPLLPPTSATCRSVARGCWCWWPIYRTENFTSHRQTLRRDDDAVTVYIIVCSNITSLVKQNKIK